MAVDMPFLSIITPSYQQAAYLEQTIKSVISQIFSDYEYLVVDGGSTDGSVDIIKRYEEHINWWVSEKDAGQADAINKGFSQAKGEVIGWINSDDFYLPGAFSRVADAFSRSPDLGLIYGDVLAVNGEGQVFNLMRSSDYALPDLMKFKIINQPSVFFRRHLVEKIGGLDLSYRYLLDHHLWLRIATMSQIKYLPELLAAGRYHSQAKNVSEAKSFGQEAFRIVDWMAQSEPFKSLYCRDEAEIRAGAYQLNGYYLSEAGEWGSALTSYMQCAKLDFPTAARDWRRIVFTLSQPLLGSKMKQKRLEKQIKKYQDYAKLLGNKTEAGDSQ